MFFRIGGLVPNDPLQYFLGNPQSSSVLHSTPEAPKASLVPAPLDHGKPTGILAMVKLHIGLGFRD